MFGLFASQLRKTRSLANDWLELAQKVVNYRRDVLSAADLAALGTASGQVRQLLRERADTAKLKLGIDALELVLRRTGGPHYPKSSLVENVEFFLVAAIVILGLRSFYVQPFKIPTNSMWPSYYGMTGQIYASKAEEPSALGKVMGFLAVGASPRRVDAPESGEVLLPLGGNGRGLISFTEVAGRSWLVLPARQREYRIFVGNRAALVRVPLDFDMDWVLRDTFFPGDKRPLGEIMNAERLAGRLAEASIATAAGPQRAYFLRTGKMVKAGERVLSFDILTGDQLFVDRMSYHFVRPKVGDGFVFRTGNIPDLARMGGDQYYIKRLVGLPGDTLRIADFTLYRNGAPITGAPAFDKNAHQAERYVGYRNEGAFRRGAEVTIGEHQYMAMGDNSANSLDGRYWGTVPAKDTVGRPLFIYYPFTKRWGPAP
ncbi:MAG: signal peptidase I [Verrucomicrobia bacterium]|nr:signal peptidase I [Verrucomicrobiota bacterium]